MKLDKYVMLALAGVAFAACSNEDDPVLKSGNSNEKTVVLSLANSSVRGVEGNVADDSYASIYDLTVYFLASDNMIVDTQTVEPTDGATTITSGATHAFTVPASVQKLHVIANMKKAGVTLNKPQNQQQLHESLISLKTQYCTVGGSVLNSAAEVVLAGCSGSTPFGTREQGEGADKKTIYTATVQIAPIVARFEIQKITAVPKTGNTKQVGDIIGFTVDGIYLNSIYMDGRLDGGSLTNESERFDNKSIAANYSTTTPGKYTGDYAMLADEPTGLKGEDGTAFATVNPGTDKCWGYQVFGGVAPHIVLKLSDIIYKGETDNVTKPHGFVTIQNYSGITNNAITAGNVYLIKDLQFAEVTDVPYEGEKALEVTVNVAPWNVVELTPEVPGITPAP